MPQDAYLYKTPDGVVQRDKLHVTYVEHQRTKADLGFATLVEGTGRFDRSRLRVYAVTHGLTVPATAAGLKTAVRRLREQEAARLEQIDAQLAALSQQANDLRRERKAVLHDAFQKGHVVRLQEATERADASARAAAERAATRGKR
jgi:hypothetical protein